MTLRGKQERETMGATARTMKRADKVKTTARTTVGEYVPTTGVPKEVVQLAQKQRDRAKATAKQQYAAILKQIDADYRRAIQAQQA